MALPTASELIFSEQANHNFSKTLGEIKRHTLSIHNRLQSILIDAAFVDHVQKLYQKPLVANERCGSWYIRPTQKAESAYFKSTDGHAQIWSFSTRRLNLHLLKLISANDGCIIVDSTRRGKRMPDALSKTIPMWCCVLNRALFPDEPAFHALYTPPRVVPETEHAQIGARIDDHVRSFLDLDLDLMSLRKQIEKPLRPIWVTPGSDMNGDLSSLANYHPIICCTASRRVSGPEVSEGGYIQGSGDDTENWAHGLTPAAFWSHTELLLSTPESQLPETIARLTLTMAQAKTLSHGATVIPPTQTLFLCTLKDLATMQTDTNTITIALLPTLTDVSQWQTPSETKLEIGLGPHKIGSRELRTALPMITSFVFGHLFTERESSDVPKVVVACDNGRDHSVGVLLALSCLYFDTDGSIAAPVVSDAGRTIDKLFIRRRLGWITGAVSTANPSGATLTSVNSYLMARPK